MCQNTDALKEQRYLKKKFIKKGNIYLYILKGVT